MVAPKTNLVTMTTPMEIMRKNSNTGSFYLLLFSFLANSLNCFSKIENKKVKRKEDKHAKIVVEFIWLSDYTTENDVNEQSAFCTTLHSLQFGDPFRKFTCSFQMFFFHLGDQCL